MTKDEHTCTPHIICCPSARLLPPSARILASSKLSTAYLECNMEKVSEGERGNGGRKEGERREKGGRKGKRREKGREGEREKGGREGERGSFFLNKKKQFSYATTCTIIYAKSSYLLEAQMLLQPI